MLVADILGSSQPCGHCPAGDQHPRPPAPRPHAAQLPIAKPPELLTDREAWVLQSLGSQRVGLACAAERQVSRYRPFVFRQVARQYWLWVPARGLRSLGDPARPRGLRPARALVRVRSARGALLPGPRRQTPVARRTRALAAGGRSAGVQGRLAVPGGAPGRVQGRARSSVRGPDAAGPPARGAHRAPACSARPGNPGAPGRRPGRSSYGVSRWWMEGGRQWEHLMQPWC
uniref:Uncharacterized protein n=1 Tax=Rangifer tarandus platyrhynchus TaxID=3082113 RepID=A0ACB0F3W0_RANTA|nr:unnamed protein product [Rangifer tarandus platyrhynchus]